MTAALFRAVDVMRPGQAWRTFLTSLQAVKTHQPTVNISSHQLPLTKLFPPSKPIKIKISFFYLKLQQEK